MAEFDSYEECPLHDVPCSETSSGLKIEVARETDISREHTPLVDIPCSKNPKHANFIRSKDLDKRHLPPHFRSDEVLKTLRNLGKRVVRLIVKKRVNGRIPREAGTGFVYKYQGNYRIQTNNHVIESDEDAQNCTIEFNVDADDLKRKDIIRCSGTELFTECPIRDIATIGMDEVPPFIQDLEISDFAMFYPTVITVYRNGIIINTKLNYKVVAGVFEYFASVDMNSPDILITFLEFPDGSISYFNSFYFKFRPVPQNVQNIKYVGIEAVSETGIRVPIQGEIVRIKGNYVIKTDVLLNQRDVTRCIVVYQHKVIGRGSRVYFDNMTSDEYFHDRVGLDRELAFGQNPSSVYFLNFDPWPTDLMRTQNDFKPDPGTRDMVAIGHPHGGAKTFTFGTYTELTTKKFNRAFREVKSDEEGCKCKRVKCVEYTCRTCPGSSGSPVFLLHKMTDAAYFSHFMGVGDPAGAGNINVAWLE